MKDYQKSYKYCMGEIHVADGQLEMTILDCDERTSPVLNIGYSIGSEACEGGKCTSNLVEFIVE